MLPWRGGGYCGTMRNKRRLCIFSNKKLPALSSRRKPCAPEGCFNQFTQPCNAFCNFEVFCLIQFWMGNREGKVRPFFQIDQPHGNACHIACCWSWAGQCQTHKRTVGEAFRKQRQKPVEFALLTHVRFEDSPAYDGIPACKSGLEAAGIIQSGIYFQRGML